MTGIAITDAMVEAFDVAYEAATEYYAADEMVTGNAVGITAGLTAAAPLIAAQAIRSAVSVISGEVIGVSNADDPFLADVLDMERISFGKVRLALNERADELGRGADR